MSRRFDVLHLTFRIGTYESFNPCVISYLRMRPADRAYLRYAHRCASGMVFEYLRYYHIGLVYLYFITLSQLKLLHYAQVVNRGS